VSVQGHLLLHKDAIYMASGNRPTVASFAVADGKFTAAGTGRGKDLFVRNNQVRATGFPLYWRPEDDHFLSPMELETPAGVIAVLPNGLARLKAQADPAQKPTPEWTSNVFQETAALAVCKNALLVTGLNRAKDPQQIEAGLCALDPADGKVIWKQALPAAPVAWGLAVDRAGRIVVTLTDGRVLGFDRE
jgi:hypothetical protein